MWFRIACIATLLCGAHAACSLSPGKNTHGENMKMVYTSSPTECCNECSQVAGCIGFTWVKSNHQCYLKSALSPSTDDQDVVSGSMMPGPAPSPPFNCSVFGCTCQGFADWYGTTGGRKRDWGCASEPTAQAWWHDHDCERVGSSKIYPSLAPGSRRGGCICINGTTGTTSGLHHKVPCAPLLKVDGLAFSVTYNVPEKCLSSSCGLIVDVHGFTMDGDAQDANTNMRVLGEQHGYIVVQPNAPLNNWNWDPLGHPCSGLLLPNATPGNQTCFVPPFDKEPAGDRAINNWVQEALAVKAWNIDRNRVHLTGFSEGGWVTGRMLCNYPHVFKSFVMLSGASNADPFQCIKPGAPQPPVLVNQGLNDLSSTWREFNAGLQSLRSKWKLGEGKVIAGNTTCGQEWEQFDCNAFGCTCQGFANWYGVRHSLLGKSAGCASTRTPWKWYNDHKCKTVAEPDVYHGGCNGCYSRTRYEGPTGVPLEVLSYSYVSDYLFKGHCFPGSSNIQKMLPWKESFAFGCPASQERKLGAKAAYVIGEEAMKWFLAHEKAGASVAVIV